MLSLVHHIFVIMFQFIVHLPLIRISGDESSRANILFFALHLLTCDYFFEADNRQRKRENARKGTSQLISSFFTKFIYLFPTLASFLMKMHCKIHYKNLILKYITHTCIHVFDKPSFHYNYM